MRTNKIFSGIFSRIFISTLGIVAAVIAILAIANYSMLDRIYLMNVKRTLQDSSELISAAIKHDNFINHISEICDRFSKQSGIRTTIINSAGNVIFDTNADVSTMSNHLNRSEIKSALEGNQDFSKHFSKTLGVQMLYLASPAGVKNGETYTYCVRQAIPLQNLKIARDAFALEIIFMSFIAVAISGLLSFIIARAISRPLRSLSDTAKQLAQGNFDARSESSNIYEISMLDTSIISMSKDLKKRISSLNKRNCELDEIFEHMNECVFIASNDGTLRRFNKSCREIFHIEPNTEKRISVAEAFRNSEIIKAVEKTFNLKEDYICEIVISENPQKSFSFMGMMLPYESNKPRALFVMHDISAMRINENLRKEFVTGVSHELKTPITSIRAAAETLIDLDNPTQKEKIISIIEKESLRMNSLIDDMLLLSRVEFAENFAENNFDEINLKAITEEAASNHETEANSFNDTINIDIPASLNIDGDFTLLQIAISNIIGNAVKYGGKNCKINIEAKELLNGHISLKISDTGVGIPHEHLSRIFERFYRVDKGRSRAMGGTGLGLAIVKHIILLHNATISADSNLGKGSTFTIIFKPSNKVTNV